MAKLLAKSKMKGYTDNELANDVAISYVVRYRVSAGVASMMV